jgi:hypothetical protein
LLQAIVPVYEDSGDFTFPASYSHSIADNTYSGQLYVAAHDDIYGFPTFLPPELYYFQLRGASRNASVFVFCEIDPGTQQPKYYARIALNASVRYVFESLGFTPLGYWIRAYEGVFALPATCVVSPERECVTSGQEFLRITTPVEITLSGDGTSSLGNLTLQDDVGGDGVPPEFPYARDAVDAILDATSYTFRITSRPSCKTVDCSCSGGLDGVVMSLFGESFTIPDDPEPIRGFDRQRWEFYDYGTNPTIVYEVFDEFFLETQVRVQASLFCSSTEQNSNIPVGDTPTWYVIVYADCNTWEDGVIVEQTRDTWIGAYDCYEHCGRFLPSGSPYPFIRVSRETTPTLGSCDPPATPSVILSLGGCE